MLNFSRLPEITGGDIAALNKDTGVETLLTDSRKAVPSEGAVFFALKGPHHDGHQYIPELISKGVRQFIVEYVPDGIQLEGCNVLKVNSSLRALQKIAIYHRTLFKIPVIGITGSNGKTIIKEWLFQLLSPDYIIAKNPGSYNSQLGVPLSVWQLQAHHQLGIFEAGISKRGEMSALAEIIKPGVGVFTNIGPAHAEGFTDQREKLNEKLRLFDKSSVVIFCRDQKMVSDAINSLKLKSLSWGFSESADIVVKREGPAVTLKFQQKKLQIPLPFNDHASIENCLHCIAVMIHFGYDEETIARRIQSLRAVPMRLELKEGINQSQIIDDTYNNDLGGLQISLEFLANQHQKKKKRVILSDILESGLSPSELALKVSKLISDNQIDSFVGIGKGLLEHKQLFPGNYLFYPDTESFIREFDVDTIQHEVILIKGARSFQFERIIHRLQQKFHGTVMEIDLGAVVENLNYFKSQLLPGTKIMAMVKAFGYGSGSVEIANVLQFHKVNYLGVAYADEGILLRRNNISLPIMVMNPSEETFAALLKHNLEPEIYSFKILAEFLRFLKGRPATVHLKIDTGMHRLGFEEKDVDRLLSILKKHSEIKIASIFSHLAGADEAAHDVFSGLQAKQFQQIADTITNSVGYKPLLHLLNSPGILRLSEYQFDMVRLGIGLYGIDPTENHHHQLKPVATLKTIISQIKQIGKGESIGYGRRGVADHDMTIATIAIGYADGFSRAFSRGVGEVLIKGRKAPVVGNVCMDMTMVDITGIDAQEGDEVIIFGKELSIHQLAEKIKTIPYEILTNTSERVKRVFVAESI